MPNDIDAKRDGFGIGELGRVPATTPYDDLIAAELNRSTAEPAAPRYELQLLHDTAVHSFTTLDDMLAFARNLVMLSTRDNCDACLFGPGYTVGDLYALPSGAYRLKWRRPLKLDRPRTHCEECGAEGDEIRNGRCTRCGEPDMIVTTWHTWENHEEII